MRLTAALAIASCFACGASYAAGRDRVPPTFAGLRSAVTCIPGPVGGDRTSSFQLTWAAAKDNVTPSNRIVYDIYEAQAAGTESFSRPTYTTRRGATKFTTPPLSSTETYYFVVRARDSAGNRDHNRRERPGRNLCV
jgi:hypothetical protein